MHEATGHELLHQSTVIPGAAVYFALYDFAKNSRKEIYSCFFVGAQDVVADSKQQTAV